MVTRLVTFLIVTNPPENNNGVTIGDTIINSRQRGGYRFMASIAANAASRELAIMR